MMVAKKKIAFLMLLTFLLIFVEPFLGYAANNSISAGSSKTADIDTAGNLKFSVKAVGASSGTRWKTVGLYVTSDPTGRNGKASTGRLLYLTAGSRTVSFVQLGRVMTLQIMQS